MERFTNILVIDKDPKIRLGLKEILSGGGNNTLLVSTLEEAIPIISTKEVGIILINLEETDHAFGELSTLREKSIIKNAYILIIAKESHSGIRLVRGLNQGAVDYITFPFNPKLVQTKIDVFKSLYYKDQRIGQLLSNIFPETILNELSSNGKFSPKRIQNGVVLFTDFVDFSSKAKEIKPLLLIKKLEYYFTRFDEIVAKYKLEKIKTMGDAYMALAGVTEEIPNPAVRAALAAIEMRDFMRNERDLAVATKRDFWEIRIGLHMGPLVAGIIGSSKFSFDVWGDTVNIASRAETASRAGQITITSSIHEEISSFFESINRGQIEIHKRGGSMEMYYLDKLKDHYALKGIPHAANAELRLRCGLPTMDIELLHQFVIDRLRSLLPENISYHDISHTTNVEKAAMRYALLEGVKETDLLLLRTAVLFHDSGFIRSYRNNEDFGIQIARSILPDFGYTEEQIDRIAEMIDATKYKREPNNLLEAIICDADHDYLGRADYHSIVNKLRQELAYFEREFTDLEWIDYQLNFLENHHRYYTESAKNIRSHGKKARIDDLRKRREKLLTNTEL